MGREPEDGVGKNSVCFIIILFLLARCVRTLENILAIISSRMAVFTNTPMSSVSRSSSGRAHGVVGETTELFDGFDKVNESLMNTCTEMTNNERKYLMN